MPEKSCDPDEFGILASTGRGHVFDTIPAWLVGQSRRGEIAPRASAASKCIPVVMRRKTWNFALLGPVARSCPAGCLAILRASGRTATTSVKMKFQVVEGLQVLDRSHQDNPMTFRLKTRSGWHCQAVPVHRRPCAFMSGTPLWRASAGAHTSHPHLVVKSPGSHPRRVSHDRHRAPE